MSKDKYPNIFSPHMEAIVFIILQIRLTLRGVLKIGEYSTINPLARMGYWDIDSRAHEGERTNCFSKIQLVGPKKYRDNTSFVSQSHCFGFQSRRFSLLVVYNK